MAKQRWPDPVTAMRELEDMHRAIWGFATTEELLAHKKSHKGYSGTGPATVRDSIEHCRIVTSVHGDAGWRAFFAGQHRNYCEAILEYVKQFPMEEETQ
jgi:hypothetical protein